MRASELREEVEDLLGDAVAGLVILALLVLFALLGGEFTPYSYSDVDFAALTVPPLPSGTTGGPWRPAPVRPASTLRSGSRRVSPPG